MITEGTMIRTITLSLALLSLALSVPTHGSDKEMYRWTDENGVVHFSDQPPEGQGAEVLQIPGSEQTASSGVSSPPPAGEGQPTDLGDGSESLSPAEARRLEMAGRREAILAARAEREKNCAEMRAQVAELEPHRRVFFVNEEGETERMDDVARTNKVAEAKAYIAENCQ